VVEKSGARTSDPSPAARVHFGKISGFLKRGELPVFTERQHRKLSTRIVVYVIALHGLAGFSRHVPMAY